MIINYGEPEAGSRKPEVNDCSIVTLLYYYVVSSILPD